MLRFGGTVELDLVGILVGNQFSHHIQPLRGTHAGGNASGNRSVGGGIFIAPQTAAARGRRAGGATPTPKPWKASPQAWCNGAMVQLRPCNC